MKFLTLKAIPRLGGGIALAFNCEFDTHEIEFQFDAFQQRWKFKEGSKWVWLRDPFILDEDYKKI